MWRSSMNSVYKREDEQGLILMALPPYEWVSWNETTGVQNKPQKIVYTSLSFRTVLQMIKKIYMISKGAVKIPGTKKETFFSNI